MHYVHSFAMDLHDLGLFYGLWLKMGLSPSSDFPMTNSQNGFAFPVVAFIGGGNMASALIGGLLKAGCSLDRIQIIEPSLEQRYRLKQQFGIEAIEVPSDQLAQAQWVVWAVKPQVFADAAAPCVPFLNQQVAHLSIMAGVRMASMETCLGTQRIVRTMPNTPALIGQGVAGVYAHESVNAAERQAVEALLKPTGSVVWVQQESQLDAVTALSGSGPAYVFYLLEAMIESGLRMGLSYEQAHQLVVSTAVGASALAQQTGLPPKQLREQVTSKGGTTYAALQSMDQSNVQESIVSAIEQARIRAVELGDLWGKS